MSWIKSKVVMLPPTKSKLILSPDHKIFTLDEDNIPNIKNLYFTSDEKIKEDDWCINANNTIVQYRQSFRNKEVCKKIIATTDKSIDLPEPSKDFLGAYIKAYNEGKPIEDVLIEYQTEWCEATMEIMEGYGDNPKDYPYVPKVKVKSDNTINIKKIKDSWNREEMEKLILKAIEWGYYRCENELSCKPYDWIEQNL